MVEVATKDEEYMEFEQVEQAQVEVEIPDDIVTLKILINTKDYIVLQESMYLTMVNLHQRIE